MTTASATETFNPITGMEARLFGRDMLAAGTEAAKVALQEVRHLLTLGDDSDELHSPAATVKAALSAGVLAGKAGFVDALAAVQSTLGDHDYEREAVGFAIHALSRHKQQGMSPRLIRREAEQELAEYAYDGGSDAVQLAVAAFAVGATIEDIVAAGELQAVLNDMVIERTEAERI